MRKRSTPPGNLPADMTAFVGRRSLLDAAGPILSRSRMVTLLGPGGVGKTRAAIQLGRTYPLPAPGGVWLADLAAVDNPELVPHTVADVLGIHGQSQRPVTDAILQHVRERGHLLLILDNCEHLAPAVAELADALILHTPAVHILATSRQPLGVSGEYALRVRPMSQPTSAELETCTGLGAIAHHDAVHLFLDRADEAGALVSDQDADAVGRLVRKLEGVPLAIELAAARTATMAVGEVLARLSDPLKVLTGTGGISHPRHHGSLDTTLAWSYQLCTPAEQRLWARLSVFTGGFDLAAAEAVCTDDVIGADQIMTVIDGLARQSLITVQNTGHGQTGHVRYRMLETVRAYGRNRLAEHDEDTELRRRHRAYYRSLTNELLCEWYSPRELDWMRCIRREIPNIRAALSNAVMTQDTETGLITAVNLSRSRVWFFVGSLPEARYWLRILLKQRPDTDLRLLALATTAWIASCQGDRHAALSIIADCIRAGRSPEPGAEDITGAMIAFAKGAYQLFCGNDFPGAVANFDRARDGLLRAGFVGDAHMAHLCLTIAAAAGTDANAAFQAVKDCSTDVEASGAQWAASWVQWANGLAELRHGDPDAARRHFHAGLRTGHAAGDNWGPAWTLATLGWTAAALGEHDRAAMLMGAADRHLQRIGIDTNQLTMLAALGAAAVTEVRTALGATAYATARKRGARLDYNAAVAAALADDPLSARDTGAQPDPETINEKVWGLGDGAETTQLSRREREVATLLGVDAGLTNKQLAAQLYVTVRTIEAHVSSIMRKLGVTSRAQIAVWAVNHPQSSQ
jgi:predicted ATPase/DNA-binding NarL/FixJ family response regulator